MGRVLVIDDEPDVLLLCRVNLEHAGHQVVTAVDGEEAIRLASQDRPDVVVLDLMLPQRDGFGVLRDLRALTSMADVPVVVLTARARWEDRVRGWQAGVAYYFTKPFAPASLAEAIDRVLAESPEQRERRRQEILRELLADDPA